MNMSARCFLWLPVLLLFVVVARQGGGMPLAPSSSPTTTHINSTAPVTEERNAARNDTDAAVGSRISTILRDLPTIKNVVIFVCVLTTLLITCLVVRVYRSGKKIRKTRKYDIITTPAERVEMAPLNEENDEDDDSTLFDVKYR
ncbi:membrane protein FAM174B [Astyanax mexicanus]|uniref:Family with sequence similarity 174 member B n=1 Tax=Astyanax mexicanus TaxID=7994 RepID=W5KJ48_ASTMX|nr:membrane protein FAM174B [Astyanax mexicanus]